MSLSRFALIAAVCLASGCDSGGGSELCDDLQLSDGAFSAALSEGEMSPNCFSVVAALGQTVVVAYEVDGGPDGDIRAPLTLTIDGTSEGTYTFGDDAEDDDESFAQVGRTDHLEPSFATSGSVTVDVFTDARLRGTFSFRTHTGLVVSDGRFNVSL